MSDILTPMSLFDTLRRLGDLHKQPHMKSSRTRRACVAVIIRLRHQEDSPYVPIQLAPPKVKKPRPMKKAPASTSTPSSPATPSSSSLPSAIVPPTVELDQMTRVTPHIPPEQSEHIRDELSRLISQSWVASSSLEIAFMQRAQNPNDRWSGQMSFPGGRQDKGETDEETAIREVREEIGWDLKDQTRFLSLGQLDDKPMDGLKNVKPLAVGFFVFLQLTRISPPLILEPTEVSAVLFVPLTYFQSLHSSHDFGRIYHPLMLQILQRPNHATSGSSTKSPPSFDLKLLGWPHKREGKLMTRAGSQLSTDAQQQLDTLDEDHITDVDDAAFTNDHRRNRPPSPILATLRSKLQSLAHELPLPHLLPRIEQLASLRFPALSLPGVWMDSEGRGGISTGDDIRTTVHHLMPPRGQSEAVDRLDSRGHSVPLCPPPFILWGTTLEKTFELLHFLGFTFGYRFLRRGSDGRRRKYQFWASIGEARWEVERQVEEWKHRIGANHHAEETVRDYNSVAPAPLRLSAFATPSTPANSSADTLHGLVASNYRTPLLLAKLKTRMGETWEKQKEKIRSKL